MDKEIHLRLRKKTYEELEKVRIENNLEDKQDLIREILEKSLFKKSIWKKLKDFFIR